jgi:hypothetical protein
MSTDKENDTHILTTFDAEDTNSMEQQQQEGWQSILNYFKKYAEQSTI